MKVFSPPYEGLTQESKEFFSTQISFKDTWQFWLAVYVSRCRYEVLPILIDAAWITSGVIPRESEIFLYSQMSSSENFTAPRIFRILQLSKNRERNFFRRSNNLFEKWCCLLNFRYAESRRTNRWKFSDE